MDELDFVMFGKICFVIYHETQIQSKLNYEETVLVCDDEVNITSMQNKKNTMFGFRIIIVQQIYI